MAGLSIGVLVTTVLLVSYRRARRRRSEARQRQALADALPEVIETVAVVVGSGGTVHEAIRVLTVSGPDPLEPGLGRLNDRLSVGVPLGAALLRWGDELGSPYRPLIGALLMAVRDGAPLSQLLSRLADEAMAASRLRAERRSKTLPVQLLFPVVLCALPAVLVGAVAPLVIVSLKSI